MENPHSALEGNLAKVGLLALTRVGNNGFRDRGRDEKDKRLISKRTQMMT